MNVEIDLLVAEYIATHPEYQFPPSGDRHPAVLALGTRIKRSLMDHLGGPLPYWWAMLESAKAWFPPGCTSREFRIFCSIFEADGNTFWTGRAEFEPLDREYDVWRRQVEAAR